MKNTITEKEREKRTDFLKKSGFFEEATLENPLKDKMDSIIQRNDKYETVKVLIMILCQELGLDKKEADWDKIGTEVARIFNAYNAACKEFSELTGDRFKTSINDLKKP